MAKTRASGKRAPLEVWKFGGASLADAAAVRHAVALVRAHRGPLVVVVSALAGVTDALLDGARRAVAGRPEAASAVAASFRRRHGDLARALVPRGKARRALVASAEAQAREYEEIAHAMAALADLSPRASDTLVARGERAASAVVAAALQAAGRRAARVDAASFVATDGRHGSAAPDLKATRTRARRALRPLLARGITPVVPGFIGSAPDGTVTTLGRGGSDLTATLVARALGAARVVLWKDVAGILTADPRAVPDARLLPQLDQREAAEVAYFGAKVLHPRALIPLGGTRIVLHVRSFVHPERPGTEVSTRSTLASYPVKALATIRDQALVTVAGKGLMGVPGMAARTFAAIHAEGLSVSTIFQSSSESSIGFTLPGGGSHAGESRARDRVPGRARRRARGRGQRARGPGRDRSGRPRHGRNPGSRRACLLGARRRPRQRDRDRAGLLGAQHLLRRGGEPGARRGPQGSRRLPALEDRRRPSAGPQHRRGAARLRARRARAGHDGGPDGRRTHPGRRGARPIRVRVRPAGPLARPAAAARRGQGPGGAARPARRPGGFGARGAPRDRGARGVAAGARGPHRRGDGRSAARGSRAGLRPRAGQQEARWPAMRRPTRDCWEPRPRPPAASATRRPWAPACR